MGALASPVARAIGRPDQARGGAGATSGPGSIWPQGQSGITAAGLSAETRVGGASAGFNLDTGTISYLMIGGIVIGFVAFYWWTKGSQR